ncbi:MAG TPA: hypothetical protein VIK64_02750 [Anaerolineales bacterium]
MLPCAGASWNQPAKAGLALLLLRLQLAGAPANLPCAGRNQPAKTGLALLQRFQLAGETAMLPCAGTKQPAQAGLALLLLRFQPPEDDEFW